MLQVRIPSFIALRNPLRAASVTQVNLIVTALLTLASALFILRFGQNLPYVDEWDLSLVIHQQWPISKWTFTRLNEHYFIPGNALWWCVMMATGLNFKAGMFVNLALHAASSLILMNAAKRIRGRGSYCDLFIPACLLHAGHAYNLLMSYQIVFGCFLLGLSLLVLAVTTAEIGREARTAKRASLALLFLMLNGGMGLAFVPPVGLWITILAWRSRAVVPFTLLAVALLYTAFALFGAPATAATPKAPVPLSQLAWCFVQYLGIGTGLWYDGPHWARNGLMIAFAYVVMALLLCWKSWVNQDGGRTAGLLALLAGHFAVGLGIAYSRGGCIAERYVTLSTAGLMIAYLAVCNFSSLAFRIMITSLTCLLYIVNEVEGKKFGKKHERIYDSLKADAAQGLAPHQLTQKHAKNLRVGDNLAPAVERLRAAGRLP